MKKQVALSWGYLLPVVLLVWLAAKDFLERSLYNDGLWYAILSRNLVLGEGTWWAPELSETIYPVFHEHPPLAFVVQAAFFWLLGDGLATERIYSLAVMLATAGLMVHLWKLVGSPARWAWLPLSFWLLNEAIYHFYPSNILEPLLGVWTLLAVAAAWQAGQSSGRVAYVWALGLGGLLWLAFLTKGPVGLFPLAAVGAYWLTIGGISWRRALLLTTVAGLFFVLALGLLVTVWPAASEGLTAYWNTQVEASLTRTRLDRHHRANHLYILGRLLQVLAPALVIGVAAVMAARWRGVRPAWPAANSWLILVGLSASLPIIISPKQSYYYLLPALPYFALALGRWVADHWHHAPSWPVGWARLAVTILAGLLLAGFIRAAGFVGDVNRRDRELLPDVEQIGAVLPHGVIIGATTYDPYLVGYFGRFFDISIDTSAGRYNYPHLLIEEAQYKGLELDSTWQRVPPLHTFCYQLFVRTN